MPSSIRTHIKAPTCSTKSKALESSQAQSLWREKCAVVGIYNAPNANVLAYYGLFAMQHRGQEASGIATSNTKKIAIYKKNGLVTQVFEPEILANLTGFSAIGHNRYSTAGEREYQRVSAYFCALFPWRNRYRTQWQSHQRQHHTRIAHQRRLNLPKLP